MKNLGDLGSDIVGHFGPTNCRFSISRIKRSSAMSDGRMAFAMTVLVIKYLCGASVAEWLELAAVVLITFSNSSSFLLNLGEDVVTVTDNAPSIEGTPYTCTCKIRKKDYVVKWLNGNDGKSIVYCYKNSCHMNSADERKYNHSYDLANNIFNLTMLNVTKDDNGKKFVCSNGINSDCAVLTVGGYEQRLEETDNGTITAVSAPSSDKNVTFKWIGVKPINGEEVKFNPKILNKSEKLCFDECGNSRYMKYEETISVATSGYGEKYHLKVAVFYGAKRIVSNKTQVAYMIEEQAAEPKYEDSSESAVAVIAAVAAAVVVAGVIAVVIVMFCRKQVIRFFNTFFKRAENPINPEVGSESGEERPLNSVDTRAGLQEPEAKIEEKVELMSKTVNGDSNQGSDSGTTSVILEDQQTESSLPIPVFYLPMKDTKRNPRLIVRYKL